MVGSQSLCRRVGIKYHSKKKGKGNRRKEQNIKKQIVAHGHEATGKALWSINLVRGNLGKPLHLATSLLFVLTSLTSLVFLSFVLCFSMHQQLNRIIMQNSI